MDAADLAEWHAFEQVDGPIGAARLDALVRVLITVLLSTRLEKLPPWSELAPTWWLLPEEETPANPPPATSEEIAARCAMLRAKLKRT